MPLRSAILSCLFLIVTAGMVRCAEPTAGELEFFEKRVRPVLVARCYECHSEDSAESDLRSDTLDGLLRGGKRGPAIVPGEPDKSLLILAINHADQLHMPPKSKLPQKEIADITAWIKSGAAWPNARANSVSPKRTSEVAEPTFTAEQRNFWAFQPLIVTSSPSVATPEWATSAIDRFVLARLESASLKPSRPADKRTLIRRATFDLIGLPPTVEEVDAFLADNSPHAFDTVVDRLLNSPHYGEHWGRHWLDLARYGDSNGLDENLAHANAYRYRDYVVSAFNQDKPYDQFLTDQIAGDLLPDDDPVPLDERLAATGFLVIGAKMLAEDDPVKMQMDIIDEQVDTLGKAVLGMTFGCARCHDHKYDPVSMFDYYGLAGIFKSTKTMENFSVVARWQERPLVTSDRLKQRDEHQARIAGVQGEIERVRHAAVETVLDEDRRHVGAYLLAARELDRLEGLLAEAKPFGPDLKAPFKPGVRLIEAEDFRHGNVLRDRDNYGAGIGVLVNAGPTPNFVEYDVEIERGGLYQCELRYAAAASRPCKLIINGSTESTNVAAKVTGSWNPDGQRWFVEGYFRLKAGQNIVRLEQPRFFPHIDKLLFVRVSEDGAKLTAAEAADSPAAFAPKQELVRQWKEYLAMLEPDSDSPFTLWRHASFGIPLTNDAASKWIAEFEWNGNEPTLERLASRYQERCRRVIAQCRDAESSGQQIDRLQNPVDESLRQIVFGPKGPFAAPESIEAYFDGQTITRLAELRQQKKSLDDTLPRFPEAMAVSEDRPQNLRIHYRGNHVTQGPEVPRRFPAILSWLETAVPAAQQSGRLELARWLTADNPLTARVIANRVWQWHFGEGLVRSPDNFGLLGERPSHPELLDHLASRLIASGWSLKNLHRYIMSSSTYRMSGDFNPAAAAKDPENRLLWRMNRRRLQAEALRDAILACSGVLDRSMTGTLLPTENRKYVTSTANVNPIVYKSPRRSIYLPVVRSALYDVFQAFDFPDPSVANGQRQSTTVAPQALFMLNSELVATETRRWAESLMARTDVDDAARILIVYQQTLTRQPTDDEAARGLQFLNDYANVAHSRLKDSVESRTRAWQSLCRTILSCNEFLHVN